MPKSTKKFQYQRRTYEDTRKRSEQQAGLREQSFKDHVPMWKPSEGENCIRILPPTWEDAQHYGIDVFMHYGIGPENSAFLDLKRMKGIPDPISEAYEQANAEGDEEYAKQLRSVKRVLVYLIDRDKPKEGPQMWAMPWTVDKEISTHSINKRTQEVLYVDDPEEGYDIVISREGQAERTRYSVKIERNPSAVELRDEWIELIEDNPLPDCLVFYDYEHIKKTFSGKVAESATKSSAKKSKKPEPPTWDEVQKMDADEAATLCDMFDLEYDEAADDEELRELLIEEFDLEPPKKAVTKPAARPARKPEPEPEEEEAEESEEEEAEEEEEEPEPEPKKPSVRDRLKQIRGKE